MNIISGNLTHLNPLGTNLKDPVRPEFKWRSFEYFCGICSQFVGFELFDVDKIKQLLSIFY